MNKRTISSFQFQKYDVRKKIPAVDSNETYNIMLLSSQATKSEKFMKIFQDKCVKILALAPKTLSFILKRIIFDKISNYEIYNFPFNFNNVPFRFVEQCSSGSTSNRHFDR